MGELSRRWRSRAEELEPYSPSAAQAFRQAAVELEESLRSSAEEELTLSEAASASGYAPRTLREKLGNGEIANAGRKGSPRIKRADLPVRPRRSRVGGYDPSEDAKRVLSQGAG